jgi:hypothetical protein
MDSKNKDNLYNGLNRLNKDENEYKNEDRESGEANNPYNNASKGSAPRKPPLKELNRKKHWEERNKWHDELKALKVKKLTPKPILPVPTSKEEFIAKAEKAISRMIDQDNPAAVIFTLKSLGASKGWIEKSVSEEVDLNKLNALKSFFDSVPTKADNNIDSSPASSELPSQSVQTTQAQSTDPCLPQGNIVQLRTNFP